MPARHYIVSPQGGGPTPPPLTRKYAGGHYTALAPFQSGTRPGDTFIGIPNAGPVTLSGGHWHGTSGTASRNSTIGPVANNTKGITIRIAWNDIDNGDGTFNLSNIEKTLEQARTFGGTLLVFPIIVNRTFDGNGTLGDGTCPLPKNLVCPTNPRPTPTTVYTALAFGTNPTTSFCSPYVASVSATESGWQTWRWHASVLAQYRLCVQAIGLAFDTHPNFGGIATQETSTGGVTDGGYTVTNFCNGLKLESDYITLACQTSRHLYFFNHINVNQPTPPIEKNYMETVAAHIRGNDGIVGGPDLVTQGGLVNTSYPVYTDVHNGTSISGGTIAVPMPSIGPTFCSVQNAEFAGNPPGDSPVNLPNLYNFATSSFTYHSAGALDWTTGSPLNLDIIIWDWHNTGAVQWAPDAAAIIDAHATFGTWNP